MLVIAGGISGVVLFAELFAEILMVIGIICVDVAVTDTKARIALICILAIAMVGIPIFAHGRW